MIRPKVVWLTLIVLYAAFFGWYTSFKGPMTAEEVDALISRAEAAGRPPERLTVLREFLEADTGDDFIMVNVIEMNDPPPEVPGAEPNATADDLMSRYMEYMWPELLKRASHPVVMGTSAAPAMDIWGIENAEDWSSVGLVRYRSRRDLVEVGMNPAFLGPHEFKIAAMRKTIAFPADPWYQLGDPRVVLALCLLVLGLLNSLSWAKRK